MCVREKGLQREEELWEAERGRIERQERKEERKKELGRNEGRKRDDAICKIGYDMILMTDNIVILFFLISFISSI